MRAVSLLLKSTLLFLSLVSLTIAAEKPKLPKSITLSYEVVGSSPSSVKPLATIFYDPRSLRYSLESWTPPSLDFLQSTTPEPTSSPLLRVLLPNGSSTVTSISTFDPSLKQNIDLWVSSEPEGTIFSASVTSLTPAALSAEEERLRKKIERAKARGKPLPSVPKAKPKKKSTEKQSAVDVNDDGSETMVKVNLIPSTVGPTPKLNSRKPPQLDADGNEIATEGEQQEKSFFQKYWWVLAIVAVLTLGGGAGGDK